jgi:hypothetical protein
MERNFCSRPSRLFAGDPSALFAQDSQAGNFPGPIADGLISPFEYQFESNPVADSQQWHCVKPCLILYSPNASLAANLNAIRVFICPNNLVGVTIEPEGSIAQLAINSLGLELVPTGSDLSNDSLGGAGYQTIFYEDFDLPPRWFIRVAILDDGSNATPFVPDGTSIFLRFQQQVIPIKFSEMD